MQTEYSIIEPKVLSMGAGMQPSPLDLPPGLVAFLLSDCKYAPDVVAGAVLEFASEGVVSFEQQPGGGPVIRPAADSPQSGRSLLPFEQLVIDRVRMRAGARGGVPLAVVISDDGDDFEEWRKKLTDALGQQAKRAGLAKYSAGPNVWWVILAMVVALVVAVVAVDQVHPKSVRPLEMAGAPLVAVLALIVPLLMARWRLTDRGVGVAAWYRRRGDRPTAALYPDPRADLAGLLPPPNASGTVPANAPLPKGQAWSALGGNWHPVTVGPLQRRPHWSTLRGLGSITLYTAMVSFYSVLIGLVGEGGDARGQLTAIAPALVAVAIVLLVWLPAFSRRVSLPDHVTFIGEVVKRWSVTDSDSPDRYYLCIDIGTSGEGMSFQVAHSWYQRFGAGDQVRVTFSPRWRRLDDISATAAVPVPGPSPWSETAATLP